MMVFGHFVAGYSQPIHGRRGNSRVRVLLYNLFIELLGLGPFLVHEGYTGQAHYQMRGEFVAGQIALDAKALFSVLIENQDSGSPEHIEAVKFCGSFLDIDGRGSELLIDELGQLGIAV